MAKASERKDEKIIAALISNTTVRAAANECGVSETQIYKRLRDDEFLKKYDRVRMDLLQHATANAQGTIGQAIEKIKEIMNDSETSRQVQLNAADALLRNTYRMTEQADILQRLEKLEQLADETNNRE